MAEAVFLPYSHAVLENHAQSESQIRNGTSKPVFLWYLLLPIGLLILALLVPHRSGGRYVRPALFVGILSIEVDLFRSRRMLLGANGYMIGVVGTWWLVWSATLLFFNDVDRNFRRIERARSWGGEKQSGKHNQNSTAESANKLVWQPYPQSLGHRLDWVLGLVLCLRGPEWNWRIPSSDPLPPQLDPKHKHSTKTTLYPSAKTRVRNTFLRFIASYLLIDLLKFLIIRDPYFVNAGYPPAPFPFNHLAAIPGLVRFYRLFVSGFAIYLALQFVTALNPIFFLGLSLAFPQASRILTSVPLTAPWLYSDTFGPFTIPILDNGLAGAWGHWWHQLFRFGFSSTAKWIISLLPVRVSARRNLRRAVHTLVGFTVSGLVHACGSFTQLPETRSFSGTFLFFILQGVGVIAQDVWCRNVVPRLRFAHQRHRPGSVPCWLRRTANGVFVLSWLLLSGGFMADDFARGRAWLTEPLPFSLLRGLSGQGWSCWQTPWFEYYDGGTFWSRGIRVL